MKEMFSAEQYDHEAIECFTMANWIDPTKRWKGLDLIRAYFWQKKCVLRLGNRRHPKKPVMLRSMAAICSQRGYWIEARKYLVVAIRECKDPQLKHEMRVQLKNYPKGGKYASRAGEERHDRDYEESREGENSCS